MEISTWYKQLVNLWARKRPAPEPGLIEVAGRTYILLEEEDFRLLVDGGVSVGDNDRIHIALAEDIDPLALASQEWGITLGVDDFAALVKGEEIRKGPFGEHRIILADIGWGVMDGLLFEARIGGLGSMGKGPENG